MFSRCLCDPVADLLGVSEAVSIFTGLLGKGVVPLFVERDGRENREQHRVRGQSKPRLPDALHQRGREAAGRPRPNPVSPRPIVLQPPREFWRAKAAIALANDEFGAGEPLVGGEPFPNRDQRGAMMPPNSTTPAVDMQEMRATEEQALHNPGRVDKQKGIVRVPIDVAKQLAVQRLNAAGVQK